MSIMKKYDIKTTDTETLKKWYYLMTLGRALDEKAPAYLLQSLGCRTMRLMPDTTAYSWQWDKCLPKGKIFSSLITGIC